MKTKIAFRIIGLLCVGHSSVSSQTFFSATTPGIQIQASKKIDTVLTNLDTNQLNTLKLYKSENKGSADPKDTPRFIKTLDLSISELNNIPRAELYTSLGASGFNGAEQLLGSASFGGKIRLTDFKAIGKKGWIDPNYVYMEYRTRMAKSPDSIMLQKTFIFPELNKSDFILGYFHDFTKGSWTLNYHAELGLNKYTASDTTNRYFESQSILTGIQAKKQVSSNTNNWLMFQLDYQILHVDSKFEKNFRDMIGEPRSPLDFHTFNLTAALGPPNAALFCTMKYILNESDNVNSPNLTRLVYTVGVRAIISSNTFIIP